jgi:hypothetical protein
MTTRGTTPPEAVDVASWDGVTIPERVRNRTSVAIAVGGSLSTYVPRRPGCYLRTSRDRQGDERSIGLQFDDAEAKRTALGWAPFTEMYRENDTSAFKKKRTVRADGSAGKVSRRAEPVDQHLEKLVTEWMHGRAESNLGDDTAAAEDAQDAQARMAAISTRKRTLITAWAAGEESVSDLRPDDYYQTISAMNAELDRLEQRAAAHAAATRAAQRRDYATEWRDGGFERRRALVGEIFTAIHVMPSGKGRAPFDPAHIWPVYVN